MAKLPTRDDLGPMPSARPQRAIARIDGPLAGTGQAEFGRTLVNLGAHLSSKAEQVDEFETERRFQEFKFERQKELDQSMQSIEPGQAAGFAEQWTGGYKEKAKEFFQSVPEKLKGKYDARLFGAEREFYGSANAFGRHEQKRFSVNSLDDHKNRLATTPDLDRARADYDSLLQKNPYLSPIEKDELRRKHLDDLDDQHAETRIRRGDNIDEVLKDLENTTGARAAPKAAPSGGRTSESGLAFIRKQEGFAPTSKWDYKQHSVGYGTKGQPGEKITKEEAERRLVSETNEVSDWITSNVKVPLTQNQHDALVSFGFNLGTDDIAKLLPDINAGNTDRVAERMLSFNKADGKTLPGLVSRRREEAAMYRADGPPMRAAGVDDVVPAEGPDAAPEGEGARLPGKYLHLSPKRRAALIYKAKTAQSWTSQQDVLDDIERIRDTGQPKVGADGTTSLQRASRVLGKNQIDRFASKWKEAEAEYKAVAPLKEMSEDEALAHLSGLLPDAGAEGSDNYKIADRAAQKAESAWKKIKEARLKDPAGAVAKSPEVATAAERIKAVNPEMALGVDENGEISLVSSDGRAPPARATEMILEARMEAQARLGIPSYQRKVLTKREAEQLLDMPADQGLLSERDYTRKLRAAVDKSEELYGRNYGRAAFESAVALHIKGKEHRKEAAGLVSKMVRGEAVKARDFERLNSLEEIDRIGRVFDTQRPLDEDRPAISPMLGAPSAASDTAAAAGKRVAKKPNDQQLEWVSQDPEGRQPIFDLEFGKGAYARAVEALKKKKK